jgi:hypothetical protein
MSRSFARSISVALATNPVQHRVVGMVSTTIGYRSKLQQRQQHQRHSSADIEVEDEHCSASPGHAHSSDNSADTEYCPHASALPSAASPSSPQFNTAALKACAKRLDSATQRHIDLSIHAKASFSGAGDGVTPSTIAKRRSRMPAMIERLDVMTIVAPPPRVPLLDRQASDAPTVSKTTAKGTVVSEVALKLSRSRRSSSMVAGVGKKPCSHKSASSSMSPSAFGKEHQGMVVCQRVVDACRPHAPQLWASQPIANRTPVKVFNSRAVESMCSSPCPMDESGFSSNSDSEDCFSEQACVPTALLDAFSPVRPRGLPNSSDAGDFELDFGWDPVVKSAVMKNAFNGFGAIRSH